MAKYFIGWDVGAWHCELKRNSRDAIFIYSKDTNQIALFIGNASSAICDCEPKNLRDFLGKLFPNFLNNDQDNIACRFAIDAILGWPIEFYKLVNYEQSTYTPNLAKGNAKINQYLYRTTEIYLAKRLKINPKSVIQDQLGSQSTKIMCFLRKMGFDTNGQGEWENKQTNSIVLETYPSILKLNNDEILYDDLFLRKQYEPDSNSEAMIVLQSNSKKAPKPISEYLRADSDVQDAMYCLRLALTKYDDLFKPEDIPFQFWAQEGLKKEVWYKEGLNKEGWIWIPKIPQVVWESQNENKKS